MGKLNNSVGKKLCCSVTEMARQKIYSFFPLIFPLDLKALGKCEVSGVIFCLMQVP